MSLTLLENDPVLQSTLILFADNSLKDIISMSGQKSNYENGNTETKSKIDRIALEYQNYAKAQIEAGKITIDSSSRLTLIGMIQSYETHLKSLIGKGIDIEFNEKKLKKIPETKNKVSSSVIA